MGPRSRHAHGLKMASISSAATGKARCFPPWILWFLLNKGWSWMMDDSFMKLLFLLRGKI